MSVVGYKQNIISDTFASLPMTTQAGEVAYAQDMKAWYQFNGTLWIPLQSSGVIYMNSGINALSNPQALASVIPQGTNKGINFLTGGNTPLLPANFWKAGRALRIAVHALYSSSALTTGADITVPLGATTLSSVTVGALANNTTNQAVDGEVNVLCTGVSSGNATLYTSGTMKFLTGVNQQTNVFGNLSNPTASTVPVAEARIIDVLAKFNSDQAVQQITTLSVVIEQLN